MCALSSNKCRSHSFNSVQYTNHFRLSDLEKGWKIIFLSRKGIELLIDP